VNSRRGARFCRQERVHEDYCIKFILMSIDNMIYSQNCIPVEECFLARPVPAAY
jgi:hypothetical protein